VVVLAERTRFAGPRLAMVAGIVGLVVDAAYLGIIFDQGDVEAGRVAVVSVFVLAVSALALVGAVASAPSSGTRLVVLGAATGGLLTVGVLGIFSIGLPLLVAAVLCAVGYAQVARAVRPVPAGAPLLATLAGIVTGAVLILGIALS
jgi:hypothetical protein